MINFLKRLVACEEMYLSDSSSGSAKTGDGPGQDQVKSTLIRLIQFVEDGSYTKAETSKFIAKNFRLSPEELAKLYSKEVKKQVAVSTIRGSISVLSTCLYGLFGTSFDEELSKGQVDKINSVLDTLSMGNVYFNNLFNEEVLSLVSRSNIRDYPISELKDEIRVLKKYSKSKVFNELSSLDRDKLAYIKKVLSKHTIVNHKINDEKVRLLKAFNLGKSNQGYVPQTVRIHGDLSNALYSSLDCISGEYDEERKDELKRLLYTYYTEKGIKSVMSGFTKEEMIKAVEEISKGDRRCT